MIEELRHTMRRRAEAVAPKPDPYRRLMLRRTRRRAMIATTVATVALSLAAPAAVLLSRNGFTWEAGRPGGTAPAELRPILDSRTRGTLAGDTGFLGAMRERAAEEVNRSRAGDPRDVYMPTDPDAIRVLFAGDITGCGRIVVLAGVTGRPLQATYIGGIGEPAQALRLAETGMLPAVAQPAWIGPAGPYQLIFGPEGSRLDVGARTRYLRDGPITEWAPVAEGVYLAVGTTTPAGTRVRVSTTGKPPAEVPVTATLAVPPQLVQVDAASLGGHGEGIRRAAKEAALSIARRTGLTTAGAKFVLRWGGQVQTRAVATVMAVTPDGGGPFATVAVDLADVDGPLITHPTGEGAIGDPARSIIVQRLPGSNALLIIAPPEAVLAKLVQDGYVMARVTLDGGVGQIEMPGELTVVVRAQDTTDAIMAETAFDES